MRTASLCLPATLATLKVGDREEPKVQPGLVKVRWRASTMNSHDYVVVTGGLPSADGRMPMSDGAGEVVAVGEGVTKWQAGDRVVSVFVPKWQEGAPTLEKTLLMRDRRSEHLNSRHSCASRMSSSVWM